MECPGDRSSLLTDQNMSRSCFLDRATYLYTGDSHDNHELRHHVLLFYLVLCCVQYLDIKTPEGTENVFTSAIFHSSVGIKTFILHCPNTQIQCSVFQIVAHRPDDYAAVGNYLCREQIVGQGSSFKNVFEPTPNPLRRPEWLWHFRTFSSAESDRPEGVYDTPCLVIICCSQIRR